MLNREIRSNIDKIVKVLKRNPGINLIKLTHYSKLSFHEVLEALNYLKIRRLIYSKEKSIFLKGEQVLKSNNTLAVSEDYGFLFGNDVKKLFKKYESIIKRFEIPISPVYEQNRATWETSFKRFLLSSKNDDIKNKKIFFLGDDDFTSVLFALSSLPKKVVVIDIDKRIIRILKSLRKKYKIKLDAFYHDYRFPIKSKERFDTFFVDPPPTLNSIKLILSRICSLCNKNAVVYLSVPEFFFYEDEILIFQRIVNQYGFVIREKLENFNKYSNESYLPYLGEHEARILKNFGYSIKEFLNSEPWLRYTIIRLESVKKIKPKIGVFKGEIYFNKL